MRSVEDRLGTLSSLDLELYSRLTDRFEAAWVTRVGSPPEPEEFLPDPPREPLSGLVLLRNLKIDLEYRSDRGMLPTPDHLLSRYPALGEDHESLVEILAWGSRLDDLSPIRHDSGFDLPSLAERFPKLRDDLVGRRVMLYRNLDGTFPAELVPEGYDLVSELRHGGMSRVALVWNRTSKRQEVLKLNDPRSAKNPEAVARFLLEIEIASKLNEGHFVPVYRTDRLGGHLYYTMPFFRGGSLRDRLRSKDVSVRELVVVLRDVARAVDALHHYKQGEQVTPIVHRDLKPENILFPRAGLDQPRIADLGLAKLLDDSGAFTDFQTVTGELLGTPGYMAPEQFKKAVGAIGPATDVYALGIILYEILTERRPFEGTTPYEVYLKTLLELPGSPREVSPTRAPGDLSAVAMKAIQKVPARRYPGAAEFADELDRWLDRIPVKAREPNLLEKAGSVARRYPKTSLLTGALAVSLLAGFLTATSLYVRVKALKALADANALRRAIALSEMAVRVGEGLKLSGQTILRNEINNTTALAIAEVVRENEGIGSLELGNALNEQAQVLLLLGKNDEALEASQRAEQLFEGLEPSFEARVGLATARHQSGRLLAAVKRPEDGRARTEKAIELFRALVAERPDHLVTRFGLAKAENNLGNFLMVMDPARAPDQYAVALEQFALLRRATNDKPIYVEWDARTRSNLGLVYGNLGKIDESVAIQSEAADMARKVVQSLPDEIGMLDLLASCQTNLGEALDQAGRLDDAKAAYLAALTPYRQLAQRFPEETEFHWGVAMVQTHLASVLTRQEQWLDADALLTVAAKAFNALNPRLSKNPEFVADVESQKALSETVRSKLAPFP